MRAMADQKEAFDQTGATVVALTPELPDFSAATADESEFPFRVLTDLNLKVADEYGLVFDLTHLGELYESFAQLSEKNGKEIATKLPLSATYVIDQEGKITYSFVDVDYRKRAEPAALIEALQSLSEVDQKAP